MDGFVNVTEKFAVDEPHELDFTHVINPETAFEGQLVVMLFVP